MRIEAYNQVIQTYQANKASKNQKTSQPGPVDQVQISSIGKDIQVAKAAVQASADIREDIVAPLKVKIDNGTYQVDQASFAEKLLQKYEEMR